MVFKAVMKQQALVA